MRTPCVATAVDEFVILLPEVAGRSGASQVANKIDAELARAWDAGGSVVGPLQSLRPSGRPPFQGTR